MTGESIGRGDLFSTLPGEIAATIHAELPGLATCEARAGRFTLEELRNVGRRAPGVFVAILGARQGQSYAGPLPTFVLDCAAYVMTKDAPGLPRDEAAGNICLRLCAIVPDRNWRRPELGQAREVRAQSLVTRDVKDVGAALWAVTWQQPCTVTAVPDAPAIGLEVHVREPGGDYVQLSEAIT